MLSWHELHLRERFMGLPMSACPFLRIENLNAGYGSAQVLFDVNLAIQPGEVVALAGRNGMGKTTLVKAVMGLLPVMAGKVVVSGVDLSGAAPFRLAQAGLGLVPEGRQIFASLSVEENLTATAASRFGPARWTLAQVYAFLPRLAERKAHRGIQLSGGEQQMLAIGRALMTNPKLLILDEATEGLAPLIRAEIWAALATLKNEGLAILVIDKAIEALVKMADTCVGLEKGHVMFSAKIADVQADTAMIERFLHL